MKNKEIVCVKKFISIILLLFILVPSVCSADSLYTLKAMYDLHAQTYGTSQLPESFVDFKDAGGTHYFYIMDKITVDFYGPSIDDIRQGFVFFDEGADIGTYLYHCLSMAKTIIPSASSMDIGGMVICGFPLCRKGNEFPKYGINGDYAIIQKLNDQVVFSCMHE